jgi:dihydroflavonol-4-reductase
MPLEAALPVLRLGYTTGWSFLPYAVEGARLAALDTHVDHSATLDELGVPGRSLQDSMRDTVRWLAEAGHITHRAAGRCR